VFLSRAAAAYKCTGLDPSQGYTDLNNYLSSKGIDILNKPLQEYSSSNKYDIVCSFLVLEHISEPLAFVRQQLAHLGPEGILVIEVPDIRNYASFNSNSVITYEHVYHYCVETLSTLLARLDLELVSASSQGISYGFSMIAAFRLAKGGKPELRRTDSFTVMQLFDDFFQKRADYQDNMTRALADVFKAAGQEKQEIAVYGTGFLFDYAMEFCGLNLQNVSYLFDDTKGKCGSLIEGKQIRPLADIEKLRPGFVLVFTEMFFDVMKQNVLRQISYSEPQIINIHHLSTN
jgi:hypothetical protein